MISTYSYDYSGQNLTLKDLWISQKRLCDGIHKLNFIHSMRVVQRPMVLQCSHNWTILENRNHLFELHSRAGLVFSHKIYKPNLS